MILKSAHNAEGAKKFVDYVLSKAGQAMVAKRLILPARTDVSAKRPGWNDLKIIDFDYVKAAAMAPETKKKFASIIR